METKAKQPPPVLLTIHGDRREHQSFYSVVENKFQHTHIPLLCIKHVLASTFGWLVLVDPHACECCLWNPTSMDTMVLPQLEIACSFDKCVLSKPPREPDCHILFNSATTSRQSFCRIGDDEFVTQSLEGNNDVDELLAIESFQGKIYGLVRPGNLFVTVDFVGKTLELKPIILLEGGRPWSIYMPLRPWSPCDCHYLIESSDGELLLVQKMIADPVFQDFCDFKVFRVDTNRMECTELKSIGSRAIFLSFWGSGFCCSSEGIRPNSIYYTDEESKDLYIFDLDERSITVSLRCPGTVFLRSTSWVDQQILHNLIDFS